MHHSSGEGYSPLPLVEGIPCTPPSDALGLLAVLLDFAVQNWAEIISAEHLVDRLAVCKSAGSLSFENVIFFLDQTPYAF